MVVESVPARVIELLKVNVLEAAPVKVYVPVVKVLPLMLVAVATPKTGVTKVGVPSNTNLPVPVAPVEVTPSMVWCPVKVLAASVLAMVAEVVGKVMVVESVPARVKVLFTVRVLPSAMVKVEPVAGVVRVTLLMVVAEATPKVGVTKVGEVEKTRLVEVVPVVPVAALR